MSVSAPPPFPDRLRLRPARRRSRRRVKLLAALPVLALTLPLWRVQAVEVRGGATLPAAARDALDDLVGTWTPALDLHRVRAQVVNWPAVGGADVRLELPGSVDVVVQPAVPVASVAIGSRWHGVAADGRLARVLDHVVAPTLGDRVARVAGLAVDRVRQVMPDDFEVAVRTSCEACPVALVRVAARASRAEAVWAETIRDCDTVAPWADARTDDRLVMSPGGLR